jgi:hypothetical protein
VRESEGETDPLLSKMLVTGTNMLSRQLAGEVQSSTVKSLQAMYGPSAIRNLGAKTALFYVLVSTRMPAILYECHFLTNADDEARARTPAFQSATAEAIVDASANGWLTAAAAREPARSRDRVLPRRGSVERALARNTLEAYHRDLTDLAAFLRGEGITSPTEVEHRHLAPGWSRSADRGLSARSIARHRVAMRQLFRFCTASRSSRAIRPS